MKIELKILNRYFYKRTTDITTLGDRENSYIKTNIPSYATEGSAGIDLVTTEDVTIYPGDTYKIKTGIALHIKDPNLMGIIVPRSGTGSKGLVLANGTGIIDSDYQGELIINVLNRNQFNVDNWFSKIDIKTGDRVAQLIFVPVVRAVFDVVDEFSNNTLRGEGGFGSTGR